LLANKPSQKGLSISTAAILQDRYFRGRTQ
jgi:hypothetical protein